ncbi:MAG: glycosyltransferase family 4 protein [Nitrospirae bacterium]|nr:glycosyltransferase family 4 protein [Nitrospirota bacterium]
MLTILHTEASKGWGGQEIRILQESLGMIKRGCRVIIAAPEDSRIIKKAEEAGIKAIPFSFNKKNPLSFIRMINLINSERIDIINTHSSSDSWVAACAARLSRTKPAVIRTRHLSTPISKTLLSRLLYNVLPDAVITTGQEIRRQMISENRFDKSRIFSIPTGIDTMRFSPDSVAPAFERHGFAIGMVGVLRSWKGHRYFIEAVPAIIREIPNAHFYIIGDGPQFQNIENLIRDSSLQERVVMSGHREDIPEIMASLDVVVHPSYANEGVPQSILQAMAMKRPVVASNAGAIKEVVINGRTGFLVPARDAVKLSEKVISLYNDPELARRLGEEGRKLVEGHYSADGMLDKIEALYKGILKR